MSATMSKPTATQADVIRRMRESGKVITRYPGGWWVLEGMQPSGRVVPTFEWSVGVQTVRAMEKRGWLRRTNREADEWRDPRELTPDAPSAD